MIKLFKILRFAISSQFFVPWLSSLICQRLLGHNALKDHIPWITFKARVWLENYLKPDMSIFEYGSGGSTIFMSKRVKEVFSVEHDKKWYQIILKEIRKQHIDNCKLQLIEPEMDIFNREKHSDTNNYISSDSMYRNMNFKRYVLSINEFPDLYFDIVFIDGRARPSCIANSIPKIRPGGYLLLDNSERERYSQGKNLLSEWLSNIYYGLLPYGIDPIETTVWRKPSASVQ